VEREEQQLAVKTLEDTCDRVEAPLRRFEHALHPWVSFLIMPLFALANAGITFDASLFSSITHPVGLGTIIGLVFGKQIGITAFSWIAIKTGLAQLPHQVKWIQLYSVSCIAGIGFTMSLFIAGLAFDDFDLLASAKIGILAASLISAAVGSIALSMFSNVRTEIKHDA
jgi:NhaA family Na+:H+ antiporter